MDPFGWLLCLCVSMFVGAFGSGYIPLSFSMSESRLRLVTIFGAGLLVGTALIVIIPEGVAMHYEGQQRHHAAALAAATAAATAATTATPLASPGSLASAPLVSPVSAAAAAEAHDHAGGGPGGDAHDHAHADPEITHAHPGHWQIGAALAVGFAFQLVVDRISGGLHSHAHGTAVPGGASASAPGADGQELNVRAKPGSDHSAKSKSALMGMVVHAFVDGVALGAAVREGDSALGLIVFIAIMLHKAPSSFGLSSYLLHHGISHDGGACGGCVGRKREGGEKGIALGPAPVSRLLLLLLLLLLLPLALSRRDRVARTSSHSRLHFSPSPPIVSPQSSAASSSSPPRPPSARSSPTPC
jgi:solute carrier family 39 (zinc transporter), member 9